MNKQELQDGMLKKDLWANVRNKLGENICNIYEIIAVYMIFLSAKRRQTIRHDSRFPIPMLRILLRPFQPPPYNSPATARNVPRYYGLNAQAKEY